MLEQFSSFDLSFLKDEIVGLLTYDPKSPLMFSSGLFLFLFLGFSLIYLMLQKATTARLLFVTLFSYYFYYKSSGLYFVLLAIVTCSDYLIAQLIQYAHKRNDKRLQDKGALLDSDMQKRPKPVSAKLLMALSLLVDLGLLGYFKYTNFFGNMWSQMVGQNFQPQDIFLPVGISFFTFQSLSYTIDVYRRQLRPLHSLLDYAFYVSFFPQLVAGPIVRARDFIPQIRKPLMITSEMFGTGIFYIVAGLFKKAVISDYISTNFVERIFDNPTLYSGFENLLGVYGYALQIYCDFSGYSDMAIGLALLLGFRFPQNFNSPYKSESVTDFWRRWHISLSTWLRDYLYISLGGNRKGQFRTYLNLFITMLLGGLWHGASLNFVLWGGLHGMALAAHKAFRQIIHRPKTYHSTGFKRLLAIVITFHFVCFCWIFFRGSTFDISFGVLRQIFTNFHPEAWLDVLQGYRTVFMAMAAGFLLHWVPDRWGNRCKRSVIRLPLIFQVLLMVVIIYIVIQVKSSEIQPFIYFQF